MSSSPKTQQPSRRPMRHIALVAGVVAVIGSATGCGSDPKGFNEADRAFASSQLAHHAQTVQLVNLTLGRGSVTSSVSTFADQTRTRHLTELSTLSRWLRSRNIRVPDTGLTHSDEGRHVEFDADIPGVLKSAEVEKLENTTGARFQNAWLRRLIIHERGAVRIAAAEVENGQNAKVVAFAEQDKASHAQRLAGLRRLLDS